MHRAYSVLANTTDGVFAVSRGQRVVLWNPGAARILGRRETEAIGLPCYELLCGRTAGGCAVCRPNCDAIRSARRGDCVASRDVQATRKDGREVWLSVSTVTLAEGDSGRAVLVHLFRESRRSSDVDIVVRQLSDALVSIASALPLATGGDGTRAGTPGGADDDPLTSRERQIVTLLSRGRTTREIAERMFISPRTVRNHIQHVFEKLDVHSRLEAVVVARKDGLI